MLHPKRRIRPAPLEQGSEDVASLIDTYFNAYNSARLREACQTFARMIDDGATIGVSIAGALTPAGPVVGAGAADAGAGSSTTSRRPGANLYHDLHFDLDLPLYRGQPDVVSGAHDVALRKDGIIRVYDVLFPADVLYKTDEWLYRVMMSPEFRKRMSGSELHHLIGKYALETAKKAKVEQAVAARGRATSWTCRSGSPSPGDSTIGLNLAAIYTASPERGPHVDPAADVTEMSALVLDAKRKAGGKSGVVIFGGGAPKNFLLQTEPQLQEILGVSENAATTTSSRSPTRAPTPAGCRARRRRRPCRGGRSIPTCCPTPSSATWTRPSRCR